MLVGLKAFEIVGGASTVNVTVPVAALFAPSSVVASVALLGFAPAVVPLTLRLMVHEAVATNDPPDHVTELPPGDAPTDPLQVVLKPLGVSTINPAGKLSVKPMPLSGKAALPLGMVKVSEVVPLSGTVDPPKALVKVGVLMTFSGADAGELSLASVDTAWVVRKVAFNSCMPRTLTLTVQVPPAAIEPPLNVIFVAAAAGFQLGAPHPLVEAAGVAAT